MDRLRRKLLAAGAAATAMAAAPRVFAQRTGQEGTARSFYEKGPVRIHYEEIGSGFPLLLIAGGGFATEVERRNFEQLLKNYQKLFRTARRLMRLGDHNERQLNAAAEVIDMMDGPDWVAGPKSANDTGTIVIEDGAKAGL